ncbi:MAG: hypothetical protein JSW61_10180 [Candidatus Thorarchaeota archaeon]|nr:MAG: hypothetical protein JSW61_10180 [Candidatus Thorarchaeota archaeon]
MDWRDRTLMNIHNRNPMILCLIGGVLIIISGVSDTFGVISEFTDGLDALFGPESVLSFKITIGILSVLTSMGGLGIIIGGLILTTRRVEVGRNVILVAMLAAILSLIMSLVQRGLAGMFQMGLTVQIIQSLGWIGGMLALLGRIVAEQKPFVDR